MTLSTNPNDPLFASQWYLHNVGQTDGTVGQDANVLDAWNLVTGKDVVIGIVDDGLQYSHPDLSPNYRSDLSYDFTDYDSSPYPRLGSSGSYLWDTEDAHGTAVAGVAAGKGNNSLGITGAAPDASLVGLRLNYESDFTIADALSHQNKWIDIYNCSWGYREEFTPLGTLTARALEDGVNNGRDGLGSIYVFAAGNDAREGGNVNHNSLANSRHTIAVGAIDHNGNKSVYSNPGASLLISGYSNAGSSSWYTTDNTGIVTTDLYGDYGYNTDDDFDFLAANYTEDFGGTSAAAPLVSGVIALMLETNTDLTHRDVQHILVETAAKNDPYDLDWEVNGAGYYINHKYGFGAIDATAAVELAADWETVALEIAIESEEAAVQRYIPDDVSYSADFLSSVIDINTDLNIEWVEVRFNAVHSYRGDLDLILESPDGTTSVLLEKNFDNSEDYSSWTFTSARHWGESAAGEWTLTVEDGFRYDTGYWNSWELNIYGTSNDAIAPLKNSSIGKIDSPNTIKDSELGTLFDLEPIDGSSSSIL